MNDDMDNMNDEQTSATAFASFLQKLVDQNNARQQSRKAARDLYDLYTDLVDAGFTKDQAFILLSNIIKMRAQ